jgi:hypothetical protein
METTRVEHFLTALGRTSLEAAVGGAVAMCIVVAGGGAVVVACFVWERDECF